MRLLYCKECGRIYFEYLVDRIYEDVISVGLDDTIMEGYLDQEAFSKNAKIL